MLSRRRLKTAIPFSSEADVKTNLQGIEKHFRKVNVYTVLGISLLNSARQIKRIPSTRAGDDSYTVMNNYRS